MTHLNNISHHLLCTALCLALLLGVVFKGAAQTVTYPSDTWATVPPIKPAGTGSQTDPFIIATEENLLWLSLNVGNTNSGLKDGSDNGIGAGHSSLYYKQTADLDLSAHEWIPIGNKLSNGFFAHYDGQGHTIKGVRIDWSASGLGVINTTSTTVGRDPINTSKINFTYGFFGWFGGHIENLVIDDAILYNGTASPELNQYDKKLGVFAGTVGTEKTGSTSDQITIRNIVINNSLITDCGKDPQAQNYMIGGLASDINSGAYSGTALIDADIQIDKIVVNVDFDMSAADINRTNNEQYYIGGIVGRYRTPRYSQIPKNAVYKGTINAKRALIAPIFAVARTGNVGAGQGANNYTKIYIGDKGEIAGNNTYNGVTEPNKIPESIYFTDYILRGETITDEYPQPSTREISGVTYTARTLLPLSSNLSFTDNGMKMFQGVNYGTYLSEEAFISKANSFNSADNEIKWKFSSSSKDLAREYPVVLNKIQRTDATNYSVSFTTDREATTGYNIKWFVVSKAGETTLLTTGSTFDDTAKKGSLTYSTNADDVMLLAVLCDGNQSLESTTKFIFDYLKIDIYKEGSVITARLVDQHGRVYEVDDDEGEWQWYGINGDITEDNNNRFLLEGQTANTLTINSTNNNYSSYCAEWTGENGFVTVKGYWSKKDVVYVYNRAQTEKFSTDHNNRFATLLANYPNDGDDNNLGRTPESAVKTMERAYEILSETNSAADNIVVVMGCQDDNTFLHYCGKTGNDYATLLKDLSKGKYNRNATITGSYGQITGGVLGMRSDGGVTETYEYQGVHALGGATVFRDITFYGTSPDGNKRDLALYCHLHDLTIANNVKVEGYRDMSANNNGLHDSKSPYTTFVGGYHNYDGKIEYPEGNAVKDQTTINIFSGCWGRVIAGSRNAGNGFNATSHNVFGHPDHPHKVEVNIAIKHTSGKGMEEYAPDQATATGANKYKYDIGLLVGGQTDGTIYTEAKMTMMSGKVGRFISGNISYGRGTYDGEEVFPADGFYGSATLTLEGGEIGELVGGTLGRFEASSAQRPTTYCEAYFYGRSILNINGGVVNGNVYGAGAGGVTGLRLIDKDGKPIEIDGEVPHTKDQKIPYYGTGTDYNGYRKISYGDYDAAKDHMPKMLLLEDDERLCLSDDGSRRNILDLAKSYCEVNINGGTVNGDVFGGGYGYSKQVATVKSLDQAGNLYGNSYVNITGGTIKGNVYGGGAGASEYSRMATDSIANAKQYTTVDWEARAKAFENLANVFGDTHVSITGGIIEGKVFAGSKGISGLPKMATLFGNTNLTIENKELSDNTTRVPVINNNIYGGSELGEIIGNTNVTIDGGAIGNCIFGGSEGEDDEAKLTTAFIGGSTNVTISGGTYFTADHIDKISAESMLELTPATRTFNIYGGGYRNCIVKGNTSVEITKSLFSSVKCLLEERTFQECAQDETFRKFSVYAAGRGILTDVCGDATLKISITGGASVPSSKPVDVANSQQFFMICGGGFAGNVYGNTSVELNGNVFARSAYGGGMYGRVEGTANLFVNGGSYYRVYGGGLLGDIKKGANLSIGTKLGAGANDEEKADVAGLNRNIYIYENVYGGNDVGGIVGYEQTVKNGELLLWRDGIDSDNDGVRDGEPFPVRVMEKVNGKWTVVEEDRFYTLHSSSDNYGVNLQINGGTVLGDVFGAGNGNHKGYYVPNAAQSERNAPNSISRMMYTEGPAYLYRFNSNDPEMAAKSMMKEKDKEDWGLYEYRPRTRRVRMHIGGNSTTDRVKIEGNVYGGGHACTIGHIGPTKDVLRDPSRFEGGGTLKINFGSHVTVKKAVYMGSSGLIIGQQTKVMDEVDAYDGTLNSDYDYHYYDADNKIYRLGFPNSVDGRNRFHAYMKLVDMDAKTQLTFYNNPEATETSNGETLIDLKPYNPATFDAQDLRWGSFYAGGARGSMTHHEAGTNPIYEYTLPKGLTVETHVVGGSENAQITYYAYKETEGTNAYKEINYEMPLFTYDGGIVYDENNSETKHYGGAVVFWDEKAYNESTDATKEDSDKVIGNETPRGKRVVMKLTVNCDFDPQMSSYTDEDNKTHEVRYGGLVYGGCYTSGITNGSVEVNCTNNLLGSYYESDDYHDYLEWSTLRHNIGRVYGGGFGERSSIWGETHVTLDKDFRGFNVFGGGMLGHVTYGTYVTVKGLSKVYNAVYGGGMRGHVGYDVLTTETSPDNMASQNAIGTHINLISGGIDRVYGGAFMGNVYGGTHIHASDEGQAEGTPRLFVGSIFGGNDVTGCIYEDKTEKLEDNTDNPSFGLNTDIRISEEPRADKKGHTLSHEEELKDKITGTITKTGKYYSGYPLVGTVYGAGNGNMGDYIKGVTIDRDNERYKGGLIHIANGNKADIDVWEMGKSCLLGQAVDGAVGFALPSVAKSRVTVNGGTIINVYGGGSMCTSKVSDEIIINYADTVARAAVSTAAANDNMTWGILRMFEDLQRSEVMTEIGDDTRFSYQIYRVFGGNNLMDMAIQPTWSLLRGNVFSVYSGGNFGKMTYCRDNDIAAGNTVPEGQPRGLNLTIKSDDIRIASVYGGGRVGDIEAKKKVVTMVEGVETVSYITPTFASDEYGATLNIEKGIIGDVYGGNNVAGNVYNGTNVNILGAISGNVYGSGNGNYIYLYDHANDKGDPYNPGYITEGYNTTYGRYFILPKKAAYYTTKIVNSESVPDTVYYGASDEEKILAINSYRPNVDKSYLKIQGTEENHVYILGNAFCGGNSSTVLYDPALPNGGNIRFEIGSHVTIGGVFLGSNGQGLADPFNITYLGNLNGIDNWAKPDSIAYRRGFTFTTPEAIAASPLHFNDKASYDTTLYPNLLSLYMRAAEVTALPTNFALPTDAVEAHIGNFCLGGNYGSMMTDHPIKLTLPDSLVIFGRVVGGCYNSRVEFGEPKALSLGGMTKPLAQKKDSNGDLVVDADGNPVYYTEKVNLTVKCKFRPWRLVFDESDNTAKLINDRIDSNGDYVPDNSVNAGEKYYYREGLCNIFGGCFTSGKTVGDIKIDLYSDVLGLYEKGGWLAADDTNVKDSQDRRLQVDRDILKNNVTLRRTVYALTGAGYGPLTEVEGNVHLRLMPKPIESSQSRSLAVTHPTIATIFGGSHDGKHIGNSTTEVRDGMVFSNLYGGSRAAYKYGSSEVIVGYPKYYKVKPGKSGTFTLDRADQVSYVAQATQRADSTLVISSTQRYKARNHNGTEVIKQTVKYREGDIVAANIAGQMVKFVPSDESLETIATTAAITPTAANALIISTCFEEHYEQPDHELFNTIWDNISINIGDNSQQNNTNAPFYGGGGIYGGGHALNESSTSYSGINTQLAYDKDNNPENSQASASIGFGGNSTIIVSDDPANTNPATTGTLHDHISIGTGHYIPVKLKKGEDRIGLYMQDGDKFVHMASKILDNDDFNADGTEKTTYYKMETDGGVYGDGRRTFVQNFRAVDITGYGYAETSPQSAKLINTFQRIDILSLNDCCLQLQGAYDYATNSIDRTPYSIARIGEIRMNSKLNSQASIPKSVKDNTNLGNMSLATPRSRNYMGFFNTVHYVGAIYSDTGFNSDYRDNTGVKQANSTYKSVKKGYIANYEDENNSDTHLNETKFKPRNLGTAPNMVGINNGNTLKIQNSFTIPPEGVADPVTMLSYEPKDRIYYGPIVGVVEVKLLTVQSDEGGGYIYAFNKHENDDTSGLKKDDHNQTFLEDTGNFVFAARAYGADAKDENFIIDDCYPIGYYNASGEPTDHATTEEVHYWYVQGHKYFYNTTLTGYTYSKPIDFYLNNADALILLSGITPDNASTIQVESITWRDHIGDYQSALRDDLRTAEEKADTETTDSRDDYQLLLTIDSKTENAYTIETPEHSFVARIPNGNAPDAYGTGSGGAIQVRNNYSDKSSTEKNTPLLGIHLHDKDTLNNKSGFYDSHLSEEDYVVIKLKAKESGEGENTVWNYYTINLTIDYLQGPNIDGKVWIENCALPGEYIYANTDSIKMTMSEELTVTGKKWYLYPKLRRSGENTYYWDKSQKVDVTKYIQQDIVGDVNRLQLPARYYQNDWQLDFVVVVNGQEFGLNNSEFGIPRLTVHNYHRMSTVSNAVKQFGGSNTEYGYDLDLDLVGGALVYIESDEDFEIFTKYVNYCNSYRTEIADNQKVEGYQYKTEDGIVWQKDKDSDHWAKVRRAEILPGFNRNGGITGFTDNSSILGYDDAQDVPLRNVKNPSGAENIRFVLTKNIETTAGCMPIGQFRGRLIGNGYTINLKSGYQNRNFIEKNYGEINYVGFVSSDGADVAGHPTAAVYYNYGRVNNSFYYNYLKPGAAGYDKFADNIPDFGRTNDAAFIDSTYASLVQEIGIEETGDTEKKIYWIGSVDNCYQNCDMDRANALSVLAKQLNEEIEAAPNKKPAHEILGNLRYRSSQSFHNGMIAYNLNQEYLKARWKSHDTDALVREQIEASYIDANDNYIGGDFLYNYYANGDYRYAYIHDATNHPEAMRLAADVNGWPNYEDHLGNGQTMHKSSDDAGRDERRWFTTSRDTLVQIDFRGQVIYRQDTTIVEGEPVIKMVPQLGNTGYFPLYMHDADNVRTPHSDFIFFGQRITADPSEREYYPCRVNYDNRVYRASGTYGSRTDYGYHFNREAEVVVPQSTAVDFTGMLDLKYKADDAVDYAVAGVDYTGKPQYKERWQFYVKNGNKSEVKDSEGNVTKYASGKYYSYDLHAGQYTKDQDGNWSYKEELMKTPTDTLIQHIFYPPLLDLPGGDNPAMLHNIKSFSVDSNREFYENSIKRPAIDDHSHVTKNLLIYTPAVGYRLDATGSTGIITTYSQEDETRLFDKFHYTRMSHWGDVEGETNQNNITGHHLRWVDHSGDAGLESHFHAANGLFHLVDRQDFNVPIDFYVADDLHNSQATNGRAWMLRQPKHYSLRNATPDANGFVIGKDAWESIALPFTANRVWAVNSVDYVEKYSRGQITHFYGNDPDLGITHHDYWLRGLVETAADTYTGDDVIASAGFARPGSEVGLYHVEGDINNNGNITDLQMTGDYKYFNNWFHTAYKDMEYSSVHNEYADTILYSGYRYLTKNAPYIVAFPGCPEKCKDKDGNEDFGYYEFDLSGNFYNFKNSTTGCNPQEILYEFSVEQIDGNNNFDSHDINVRIPVTDLYEPVRRTKVTGSDGIKTTHIATFRRIAINEKEGVDEDLYVLNDGTEAAADPSDGSLTVNVKGSNVKLPPGSAFINCKDFGIKEILPFTTYLKVEVPTGARSKRYVLIGDGNLDSDISVPNAPNKPADPLITETTYHGINVFVKDNSLVITSDHEESAPLYGISGMVYSQLTIHSGYNVYRNLRPGVYIVLGKKFVIRH